MNNNSTLQSNDDVTINDVEEEITHDFIVSTLDDENDGDFSAGDLSLREAIALANQQEGSDTITFDESLSGGTISFDSSLERNLNIDESVSISGLGQDNLTLDGGFIFNIAQADNEVTIDGLNLIGGTIDNSGNLTFSNSTISETLNIEASSDYYAIISRGNANIIDSTIKDNNGGSNVGIVIEAGTATIERSAITGNDSTAYAQSGVIIYPETTVDIINSTIANNRARSNAGIENAGGTVNITNSTIANNSGGLGSGGVKSFLPDGVVTITSSIIANNTGYRGTGDVSDDGIFISGGNNLISNGDDAEGFVDGVNGDIVGSNGDDPENPQNDLLIDPQLGELQNNGGSTETIALLDGSPAIDAGSNPNNLETDQRGEGFDRTVGNGTDIGAYEVQETGGEIPDELIVSTLEDENDGDFSAGDLSLREAIALANQREGADTITFESGLNGSIILSQGELLVEDPVIINGLGAENTIIDGNNSSRVFRIDDGNSETDIDVTLDGVSVTNGFVAEETTYSVGGGILNQENLTIVGSIVTNNSAEDPTEGVFTSRGGGIYTTGNTQINDSIITGNNGIFGGGIYSLSATVTITDSTVSNNYAGFVGGGLYNNDTELNLNSSIITGNEASFAYGGIGLKDSTGNITYSTVSDNIALNASSGGINLSNSAVNISYSTISGNAAQRGNGGGIGVGNDSTANISNSTIANNNASDNGGGINAELLSTTNITNSTISGNAADNQGSGIYQRPDYFVEYDGSTVSGGIVTITSTIVADNANNRDLDGDRVNSNGNNLIGNGDGIDGFVDSDLVGTVDNPIDPRLGELQDNGGVTETIALLEDSPAIDAGSNPDNLETDQRGAGFDRTVGNGTDIGAYEVQTTSSEDEIIGTPDNDFLQGSNEGDRIFGLDGADFLDGLDGDDFLSGGDGNDYLQGGDGSDSIEGDAGSDLISGGDGNDLISGGDGNERVFGNDGADTIDDGAGNDVLFGGDGEDVFLASNSGNDSFTGGSDGDVYVYDLNPDAGFFDRDRLLDFDQSEDKIAFRPLVSDRESLDNFDDLDTDGSGILDEPDDRVTILFGSTIVDFSDFFGRSDGSDTITLVGITNLDSSNFLFNETVVGTEFG
ncbi:MAG: choice-of-anchor Q domain-containing protein [Pleurocapsa sp. MO_226.B13]|nr:choice-of-anchor Q domain-containing protein [Pleurocapsa sp. MO_226.B13]